MRNCILKIIFLSFILCLGCFQKQGYEVTEPESPRYALGGTIVDSLNRSPLDGCVVTVRYVQLIYPEDDFERDTVTTDSMGTFLFSSIPPGYHHVYAAREGYCQYEGKLMMYFTDRLDYNISLINLLDAPRIAISNSTFVVSLPMGNEVDRTLTIFNRGGPLVLSWSLTGDGGWLRVTPKSGSVPPQGSQGINLHFDTNGLLDGVYTRMLQIQSNDCVEPIKEIFVRLEIT